MSQAVQEQAPPPSIQDVMSASLGGAIWGAPSSAGSSYICSIYPRELRSKQPHISFSANEHFNPQAPPGSPMSAPWKLMMQTNYYLPAVPRDAEPFVMEIKDTAQQIQNIVNPEEGAEKIFAPIPAFRCAEALVQEWSFHTIGADAGRKIGVGLIKGPKPTMDELRQLEAQQRGLFEWLVLDADRLEHIQERNRITSLHRDALEWLGADAGEHDWFKSLAQSATKKCLNCKGSIDADADGCKHCGMNLVEYLARATWYPDEYKEKHDPHCWSLAKRLIAHQAQQAQQTIAGGVGEPNLPV